MAPDDTHGQETLGANEFPVPFGIEADTGERLPGITPADLTRIDPDRKEVRTRSARKAGERFAIADVDPNNLEEAGWCVLFAKDADPAVKDALKPLLVHREGQSKRLFKVFEGASSFQPGDDARKWIERQGAGFTTVDPEQGVPLYVLVVGSPQEIPFEFQYLLDLYWNVGRLHFDTPAEYRAYAESVVAYESGATVPQQRRAAIFTTKNDGDRATALLHDQVAAPIVTGTPSVRSLAGFKGFQLTPLLAEDATKDRLMATLRGKEPGGAPAFLFTGSHGVKIKMSDPMQRERMGALVCQDWPGFGRVEPGHLLTAEDIQADAKVHGLIHFLFACYGGGCPRLDTFGSGEETSRLLVQEAIVARLPQRILAKGALASLAHVDRAWAYSFQNSRSAPQVQEMRDVMVRILQGQRLGQATDGFNMRWAVLSAELQESRDLRDGDQEVSDAQLANRWVARNDARNYLILGDPAVRLRTEAMTA